MRKIFLIIITFLVITFLVIIFFGANQYKLKANQENGKNYYTYDKIKQTNEIEYIINYSKENIEYNYFFKDNYNSNFENESIQLLKNKNNKTDFIVNAFIKKKIKLNNEENTNYPILISYENDKLINSNKITASLMAIEYITKEDTYVRDGSWEIYGVYETKPGGFNAPYYEYGKYPKIWEVENDYIYTYFNDKCIIYNKKYNGKKILLKTKIRKKYDLIEIELLNSFIYEKKSYPFGTYSKNSLVHKNTNYLKNFSHNSYYYKIPNQVHNNGNNLNIINYSLHTEKEKALVELKKRERSLRNITGEYNGENTIYVANFNKEIAVFNPRPIVGSWTLYYNKNDEPYIYINELDIKNVEDERIKRDLVRYTIFNSYTYNEKDLFNDNFYEKLEKNKNISLTVSELKQLLPSFTDNTKLIFRSNNGKEYNLLDKNNDIFNLTNPIEGKIIENHLFIDTFYGTNQLLEIKASIYPDNFKPRYIDTINELENLNNPKTNYVFISNGESKNIQIYNKFGNVMKVEFKENETSEVKTTILTEEDFKNQPLITYKLEKMGIYKIKLKNKFGNEILEKTIYYVNEFIDVEIKENTKEIENSGNINLITESIEVNFKNVKFPNSIEFLQIKKNNTLLTTDDEFNNISRTRYNYIFKKAGKYEIIYSDKSNKTKTISFEINSTNPIGNLFEFYKENKETKSKLVQNKEGFGNIGFYVEWNNKLTNYRANVKKDGEIIYNGNYTNKLEIYNPGKYEIELYSISSPDDKTIFKYEINQEEIKYNIFEIIKNQNKPLTYQNNEVYRTNYDVKINLIDVNNNNKIHVEYIDNLGVISEDIYLLNNKTFTKEGRYNITISNKYNNFIKFCFDIVKNPPKLDFFIKNNEENIFLNSYTYFLDKKTIYTKEIFYITNTTKYTKAYYQRLNLNNPNNSNDEEILIQNNDSFELDGYYKFKITDDLGNINIYYVLKISELNPKIQTEEGIFSFTNNKNKVNETNILIDKDNYFSKKHIELLWEKGNLYKKIDIKSNSTSYDFDILEEDLEENTSILISDDDKYIISYIDIFGNYIEIYIEIDNIKPEANISNLNEFNISNREVNISWKENEAKGFLNGKLINNNYTVYETNTYEFILYDKAGNFNIYHFEINNSLPKYNLLVDDIKTNEANILTNKIVKLVIDSNDENRYQLYDGNTNSLYDSITNTKQITNEGVYNLVIIGKNSNIITVKIIIDKTAPSFNVDKLNSKNISNKSVLISWLENDAMGLLNNNKINNNYTIYEEGNYTFELIDQAGNKNTINFKIDFSKPKYKLKVDNKYTEDKNILTNKNITVEISAEDTNKYELYDSITNSLYDSITKTKILTEEGSYKLVITNEADNAVEMFFKIDKTSPTYTVDKLNSKNISNKSVLIYWQELEANGFLNNNKINNNYTIYEEGNYTFELIDQAGNKNTISFTIDFTKPKFKIKINDNYITEDVILTNKDITIEVDNNDKNIYRLYYSHTNDLYDSLKENKILSEEGSYKLIIINEAENETEVLITIDKTAPEANISNLNEFNKTNKEIFISWQENDLKAYLNGKLISNKYTIYENNVYELKLVDLAGNYTIYNFEKNTKKITIDIFDLESSNLITKDKYNKKIKVSKGENSFLKYRTNSENYIDINDTLEINSPGIYEFQKIDLFGNEINKIIELKFEIGEITKNYENNKFNHPVVFTWRDPNIYCKTEEKETYIINQYYDKEGKHIFTFKDDFGNIKIFEFEIRLKLSDIFAEYIENNLTKKQKINDYDIRLKHDFVLLYDSHTKVMVNKKEYNGEKIAKEGNYFFEISDEFGNTLKREIKLLYEKTEKRNEYLLTNLFLALVLISAIVGATVILIIKTNNSRKNKLYKIKKQRKEDANNDDRI